MTKRTPTGVAQKLEKLGLGRRTLLRGVLAGTTVAVGLPALDLFLNESGTAYAGGVGLPTRFGIFFFGNGVIPSVWNPPLGRSIAPDTYEWEARGMLEPLADVKSLCSVVSGTKVLTTNTNPHLSGPAGLFAGADLVDGTFVDKSIDQRIADEIGDTRFRSLQVGVQPSDFCHSMTGPAMVNPPETNPFALYERIFGAGFRLPGEVGMVDPRLGLRRSVLDAVSDQTTRLQRRVGAADRARLDQHFTGIRELELQLARLEEDPPMLDACARPVMPEADYPDIEGRPQLELKNRAICDLLVMAMACDQTRVFYDMFSQSVNNMLFLDAVSGHHQLTHDEPDPQPEHERIVRFIVSQFAYLVSAMQAVREGDGTLLDHSAVLFTTDCSLSRTHALDDYPMVIAGNASGALRTNVHYRSPSNENASKVALTLMNAVGVTAAEYGFGEAHTRDSLGAIET
ncbi:MAG: DUF1552 domain-containing protein [Deltaproteobacteria bacterium]|nr:DUF1552 domain-containing protein [Deltaproteobacteria bacterium]